MADYTTSKLWASCEMESSGNQRNSFGQRMEWRMLGGLQNFNDNCPDKAFADITYAAPCSYAAYELGAWAVAYLLKLAGQDALLDTFLPSLNDLGWEGAFVATFEMSSETFYQEFDAFLELPLSEQMAILPDID